MGKLDGKVAVITGAARGMGAAAARKFAAEGAKVVLGDILETELKEVAESIGDAARYLRLDVSELADHEAAVALAKAEFGGFTTYVNNAGILIFGSVEMLTEEQMDALINVNQKGVLYGMKAAIPALKENELVNNSRGSIVNISSVEGIGGGQVLTGYSATKFAVRGMTKAAALDYGGDGIRVNSIHPGAIETPMVMKHDDGSGGTQKFIGKKTALRRMGQPEEVANVMAFLASDEASYMTGSEVIVDGGTTAHSGFFL